MAGHQQPTWEVLDAVLSNRHQAVDDLLSYFAPVGWTTATEGFTGSAFDTYPGGGPSVSPHRITDADIVAVSMLSVDIPARVAHLLVQSPPPALTEAMRSIPPEARLADQATPTTEALAAARAAWAEIELLPGMGLTKTSKLLARKRPGLIPIQDSLIQQALGYPSVLWEPLRLGLRHGLDEELAVVHRLAGLPRTVSLLRVLDVVLWRHQKRVNEAKTNGNANT